MKPFLKSLLQKNISIKPIPATAYVQMSTFGSTTNSTNNNISLPSAPTTGNFLIIVASANSVLSNLTGWNNGTAVTNGGITSRFFAKTSAGTEQTVNVVQSSSGVMCLAYYEFNITESPANFDQTANSNISTGVFNWAPSSITMGHAPEIIFVHWAFNDNPGVRVGPILAVSQSFTLSPIILGTSSAGGSNDMELVFGFTFNSAIQAVNPVLTWTHNTLNGGTSQILSYF